MLELRNQLIEGQKIANNKAEETSNKLDRIEKKIDCVIEQTADLTEFRTETRDKLDKIEIEVKGIREDLNTVEIVTSKNWNEIARLKAVK